MTRIDVLQEKYPAIPRDVIVKYDAAVQGIRGSDDLDKLSVWTRTRRLYQSMDYDVTLNELAKKMPSDPKPGHLRRPPNGMLFESGLGTDIRLRATSPYTIREVKEGRFAICEGEESIQNVYFLRPKPRTTPEPVTSRGTPISTLIEFQPRCSWINPMRYCEYFSLGQQCSFCNLNPGFDQARSVGLDHPSVINLEETVEAYKIRSSEVRQLEVTMIMGGLMSAEQEAKLMLGFVDRLAGATANKANLTVATQAMDRKDMQRLKDAGLDCFRCQLEIMDAQLFAEICPGKAKHAPYERWLAAFDDAIDLFGAGNVAGHLVSGVTLLSPNGHKTWQEARDYHIEANTWLIKKGALPNFYVIWWAPGSVYAADSANLAKFPPTEYYLEVGQAHHEAMLEYGRYETINKLMYCGLDCQAAAGYFGDLGMLALGGDAGNWMADVVSDEENWLAKFIASVKSPAKTE